MPVLRLATLLTAASILSGLAAEPTTLAFADLPTLQQTKTAYLAKDPKATDKVKRLLRSADRDLNKPPLSVTHKKITPPSGSKHDYLSLAPYWWPDPDKPDGLPWIRKDGRTNPETRGDHTDVERKVEFFSRVNTLGMAAYYSDDPRYAKKTVALLHTWFVDPDTRMNPNLNFGQGVPGREDGRCFGIIEWLKIDNLITPIQLLRSQNAIPPETDEALTQWFTDYLAWLQTSKLGQQERDCHNNHGTWYDVQVCGLLLFLNRPDEARTILEQVKTKRIATQIEPDGRQPHELKRTKSLSYSKMNLSAFHSLADLGDKVGVDLRNYETNDGRSIQKAQAFLAPYLQGDKKWPYQQLGRKK